ncbi:TauD/TfdA family dioxygenase [Thiorhodovibrio frisius]|uniref:Taurine catabolism dioxygenase TauD, TfdA family n=1 Tax=Thiorhodovibrio frisius TaxID=631362 RepID=H8Z6S2_9GAMM|nr:TauD/TfdA family dioxygenase [Thiorhodovibrio frisius]EIC20788.1 Taurine catabolism dioxygenase TauD, TfdA family [Thiorhodovibrio frisius]WPL21838.1 trimethyllysine dioxygenase [Thiorhodovibrio frisius]
MFESPFDLDHDSAYEHWRERKLASAPSDLNALIVEVKDPRHLTPAEYQALFERCQLANMAIYASRSGDDPSKEIPVAMGRAFGLNSLDHNPGADDDAVTALTVQEDARHRDFIPYSNRPIAWHTDGYYNSTERQIRGLLLHCVRPAHEGGENELMDHEVLYILIRDRNPAHIRALMEPDCMTIPAHTSEGKTLRPDRSGPVFSVTKDGHLHMRFTQRSRNIRWRDDPGTKAAVDCLNDLLATPNPWRFRAKLESGWGLIGNNVLHTRSGFSDNDHPRLLYRARYYERINGT